MNSTKKASSDNNCPNSKATLIDHSRIFTRREVSRSVFVLLACLSPPEILNKSRRRLVKLTCVLVNKSVSVKPKTIFQFSDEGLVMAPLWVSFSFCAQEATLIASVSLFPNRRHLNTQP